MVFMHNIVILFPVRWNNHSLTTPTCSFVVKFQNFSVRLSRDNDNQSRLHRLSVGFPLPMCCFTFKELDRAQKKAHQAMVAKCGHNQNSSLAMLFGPTQLGGASFFHLHNLQGFGQISCFLRHWLLVGHLTLISYTN